MTARLITIFDPDIYIVFWSRRIKRQDEGDVMIPVGHRLSAADALHLIAAMVSAGAVEIDQDSMDILAALAALETAFS